MYLFSSFIENEQQNFVLDKCIVMFCTKYGTDESTFILNIGSAAGAPNCSDEHVQSAERSELIGQWFIGNQLVDGDTKRTYYPDILYRHPFAEEGIETVSIVRRPDEMKQMIRMDASVNGGQKRGSSLKRGLVRYGGHGCRQRHRHVAGVPEAYL